MALSLTGCAGIWGAGTPQTLLQHQDARAGYGDASWMKPGTSGGDLLYVAEIAYYVYVYSYPTGELVGTLTGFTTPTGMCVDGSGNVFITDEGSNDVQEYAHGGTSPIATLDAPGATISCSIDPATGNLAVVFYAAGSNQAGVAVYKDAQGTPALYDAAPDETLLFCGYDDKSNLFVDGSSNGDGYDYIFRELPNGAQSLVQLHLRGFRRPWQIQWDGSHVTVEDNKAAFIAQVTFQGTRGQIVYERKFNGLRLDAPGLSWIQGSSILIPRLPDFHSANVGIWPYPGRGKSSGEIKLVKENDDPEAAVVSAGSGSRSTRR